MSEPDAEVIYVFTAGGEAEDGPPGEAISLPWRKPKAEPVDESKLLVRFGSYAKLAEKMMAKADETNKGFQVDEITLHLGVSSDFGVAFIGQVGVETAIDVVLRRKP